MYICTKCIEGSCERHPDKDTRYKDAYKCNKCGFILYWPRDKIEPVLFVIGDEELSPTLVTKLKKSKIKIFKVPLNIADWDEKLKANIEAYEVMHDLVHNPLTLAINDEIHYHGSKDINKALNEEKYKYV